MTPGEFIAAIAPAAVVSMNVTKIPASFTIAQAALESRWGDSDLCKLGRNLFGVKTAGLPVWTGRILSMPTAEYVDGKRVVITAQWRAYDSWLACINDHAQFILRNPRYAPALAARSSVTGFVKALAAAGYATDPDYVVKILAIIAGRKLEQYDAQS